jgi:sialic acid synthase SpsE
MKAKMILEVCYNHNGKIDIAKQMIDEAVKLKVWAVKFQKWDVEGMPDDIKNKERDMSNSFGKTYYLHRKKLEFKIEQLLELKEYAESKGLVFICSGKDYNSIVELVENGCKYIKVPSQRLFDNDIYKYLTANKKSKGLFILVSCGMIEENELKNTSWSKYADVFFHCISLYNELSADKCQMSIIRRHSFINGYSSHEDDGMAIPVSIAMGVEYIERHFTLDKTMKGSDHKISSTPDEVKFLIKTIESTESICGTNYRFLTDNEKKVRNLYRSF